MDVYVPVTVVFPLEAATAHVAGKLEMIVVDEKVAAQWYSQAERRRAQMTGVRPASKKKTERKGDNPNDSKQSQLYWFYSNIHIFSSITINAL